MRLRRQSAEAKPALGKAHTSSSPAGNSGALSRGIAALILSGLSALNCAADSYTVGGVTLPVDRLEDLGDNTFKVTQNGSSTVVPGAELPSFVVTEAMKDRAGVLPEHLLKLLDHSLKTAELQPSALLIALLKDPATDDATATKAMHLAAGNPRGVEALKHALSDPAIGRSFTGGRIYVRLLRVDPEWVKSQTIPQESGFERELEAEFFNVLSSENSEPADSILRALEVLGDRGLLLRERLASLGGKVNYFTRLTERPDARPVMTFLDANRGDSSLEMLIDERLTQFLKREADRSLKLEEPFESLLILSYLSPRRISEEANRLIQNALKEVNPKVVSATSGTWDQSLRMKDRLGAIALANPQLKEAFIGYLERELTFLLKEGDILRGRTTYERIESLQPDSHEHGTKLLLAKGYLKRDDLKSAREILLDVPLTAGEKFGLFVSGYYGPPVVPLLTLVAAIAAGFLAIKVRRRRRMEKISRPKKAPRGRSPREQPVSETRAEEAEKEPAGLFVRRAGGGVSGPMFEEYKTCLAVFGLEHPATGKQIKAAYRKAVKHAHPDLQGGAESKASSEFIALTTTHDRLLELRGALGLVD